MNPEPPPLTPFGLVLHHDGRWTHEGQPVLHRRMREHFDRSVQYLASEQKFVVTLRQAGRGFAVTTTRAAEQRTLDRGAYALALRLYLVVAGLVLAMAVAGLVVSSAVQLPSRRRDAAALRVVGVPRRSVMAGVALEFLVVLGAAAVAGILAGTFAQDVVLRTVTLGYADALGTPALVASIDSRRLALWAFGSAAVLAVGAVLTASITVRGARGATLRESAR